MAYGNQQRGGPRRQGAVRPRKPGSQNRNGQMEQLLQDAMMGRQIRMSRMQRNQARGNRNPGPARRPRPQPRRGGGGGGGGY